jgi:NTE family protein
VRAVIDANRGEPARATSEAGAIGAVVPDGATSLAEAAVARRRGLLGAAAALVAAPLAGCSLGDGRNHDGDDAPRAAPIGRPVRVAWVLGSGGPRGFVHVGVLKGLDELGLAPDLIVGSSVGAVVGTLHASGLPVARIEELALALQPPSLVEVVVGGETRLSAAPLAELLRTTLPQRRLERMPTAMACVAWRRDDRTLVAFTAGDAGTAVQASAAIEGRFAPVRIRGADHVDADWHAPLPVRVARALGARKVLAVDASARIEGAPAGAERWRDDDLRKRALIAPDARAADLVLHPDIGYWAGFSRDYRERVIEAGRRAAHARADALRALHAA